VCDEYFVPALDELVEFLHVDPDVAGATFMAAGGSMPELATSAIGTFTGSDVGFGTVVGSAVFNVLFVIGCCAIFSKETLTLTWWPLFRDCCYYSVSLIVLAVFFGVASCQRITWYEALILLLLYVGYCTVMCFNQRLYRLVARCGSVFGRGSAPRIQPAPPTSTTELQTPTGKALPKKQPELKRGFTGRFNSGRVDSAFLSSESPHGLRAVKFRRGFLNALLNESPMHSTVSLLSLRQVKGDMKAIFDSIDVSHTGSICGKDVTSFLEALWSREVSAVEVQAAMRELDTNEDGVLSYEEFVHWYAKSEQRLQAEFERAFQQLDTNGDGHLTAEELAPLLTSMNGGQVSSDSIESAMREIEALTHEGTNDGKLDVVEFGTWYKASLFWEQARVSQQKVAEMTEELPSLAMPEGSWGVKLRWLLLLPILAGLIYTVPDVRNPKWKRWFAASFLLAIAWIGVYSFFMVWAAESFGVATGIPSAVMGITFLAAGTSIPDLLTSVLVARQGHGDMAVSSSVGSNIFDVLVGLPFPWLLYALVHQTPVSVTADSLVMSVLLLFLMLVAVVTTVAANGWKMTRTVGGIMFVLYIIFVTQDLLFQFCVIPQVNLLGECRA